MKSILFFCLALIGCVYLTQCKTYHEHSRILNGIPTELPFVANINDFCTGTIIDSQWVLTAAKCVQRIFIPSILEVGMGGFDVSPIREGGQRQFSRVQKIIIHPDYVAYNDPDFVVNNIALLKLATPAVFNSSLIDKAKLPKGALEPDSGSIIVAGFSANNETSFLAGAPMQLTECISTQQETHQICTTPTTESIPCHFLDRGAFIGFKSAYLNKWIINGVTSYVPDCQVPIENNNSNNNNNDIWRHEDVFAHKEWIENVMKYQ